MLERVGSTLGLDRAKMGYQPNGSVALAADGDIVFAEPIDFSFPKNAAPIGAI
jgi:hypothetical protein